MSDWIEPRFFVPDNVAITTRGLLFLYNPYEAKAYAAGQTRFWVPFDSLRGILKDRYIVSTPSTQRWFYEKDTALIHLRYRKVKEGIAITVDYEAIAPNQNTYVSFSFPTVTNARSITIKHADGVKRFKLYPVGSKLFALHRKHKTIKSRYVLLEAHGKYMHRGHLAFTVKKDHVVILMRLTLTNGSQMTSMPSFSKSQDQQGFDCFAVRIP